jgi:hypothetical protein
MSDARGLLDRISSFRQRLETVPEAFPVDDDDPDGTHLAVAEEVAETVSEPEAFRHSLRRIVGTPAADEGPAPAQFTARAHRLLQIAKGLLDRQKAVTTDPVFAGLSADADDVLVRYHHETVAVLDSAVRLAQVFPDSPTSQLRMCDGLDGVLEIVKERLTVQERALAKRSADLTRIDRLAAVLTALQNGPLANLAPVVALAEELLEDARQTRPIRFLSAEPDSTRSYAGGPEFPAPARFLAAHALTTAQVVARIVPFDFEWAARPLLPVVVTLLMDCTMMRVPAAVLAKPGPLTAEERRLVEGHPQAAAELLLRMVPDAAPLADAVATHHERTDGTGYPVGLKGTTVPALGRLLAVADTYASLCCPRPHRPAADTRAALTEVLLHAEHGGLDRDFAEHLVQLAFYPVGTVVELADGRVGVVAANHPNRLNPQAPTRPVVAVLADADGAILPRPEHLDLSASNRGGILRSLPADRRRQVLGARYPDLV